MLISFANEAQELTFIELDEIKSWTTVPIHATPDAEVSINVASSQVSVLGKTYYIEKRITTLKKIKSILSNPNYSKEDCEQLNDIYALLHSPHKKNTKQLDDYAYVYFTEAEIKAYKQHHKINNRSSENEVIDLIQSIEEKAYLNGQMEPPSPSIEKEKLKM